MRTPPSTPKIKAIIVLTIILLGYLVPERKSIPVEGASHSDWHPDTFWYEPWGSSGVHKGIDIFAQKGTPVIASSDLLIIYNGSINKGGKIVLALGPKWRLHYFAHLDSINKDLGLFLAKGSKLGSVGDSGNAKGKQAHLHFSIVSMLPLPWRIDGSTQGYKKAFYINPIDYFDD